MRRLTSTRRPLGLAVLVLAMAAACGDGVTIPGRAAGYYRLVSVNGQLPYVSPPSGGLGYLQVWRGDLVLRSNGTFRHGLGGNVGGFVVDGTYRVSNGELELSDSPLGVAVSAQLSGDSLRVFHFGPADNDLIFTYRRAQLASTTFPGDRYRLRAINGRTAEPLVVYDTTIGDHRSVGYVNYDSLEFSDGVFFRRHRAESDIGYTNGQQTMVGSSEWTTWGAYESRPGSVVLFHYSPPLSIPIRDSLTIASDTLVRRTALITGIREERYTRP